MGALGAEPETSHVVKRGAEGGRPEGLHRACNLVEVTGAEVAMKGDDGHQGVGRESRWELWREPWPVM